MLRMEDVSFPAEGGIELSGWLFVREDQPDVATSRSSYASASSARRDDTDDLARNGRI
jgi:hypothetical protein